jgi:hypothetical protein
MSDNGHYTPDIITTEDEEGKIHQFEKVDELEVDGQKYALLIYLGSGETLDSIEKETDDAAEEGEEDEDGYDEEVVVMKVTMDGEAEVYEAIEDEDEFEKVVQYIESLEEVDEDEEDEEE